MSFEKKLNYFIFGVSIFILVLYCIAGLYCHPSGDDFTYALLGKSNFLETVLAERERWNGRYISNFLVIASPLNWGGFLGYQFMSICLIIVCLVLYIFIFNNIVGKGSLLIGCSAFVINLSILPDITEGIYWYTGAWTYIPGILLLISGLSILLKKGIKSNLSVLLFTSLIFILACGFNELVPLLGFFIFLIWQMLERKSILIYYLVLFSFLFLYVFLAEGNSKRAAYFTSNHNITETIFMGLAYTIRFIGEWIINPAFYLIIFVISKSDYKIKKKPSVFKNPLFIIFFLTIPTFISCAAPIWNTGILGQYRTPNLSSTLFVLSVVYLVLVNKDFISSMIAKIKFQKLALTASILFFISWKNNGILFYEIANGSISRFDIEMNDRYEKIKTCADNVCYLPEIKNKSKTLFVYPLTENPKNWQNECYQLYFKSGEIHKEITN